MKHKHCSLLRKSTEISNTGLQLTRTVHFVARGKRVKLKCTFSAASHAVQ